MGDENASPSVGGRGEPDRGPLEGDAGATTGEARDDLLRRPAALVTGAARGIGRAIVVELARRGWRVFAGVRRDADGAALADEVPGLEPVRLDVTDADELAGVVRQIADRTGGRLRALVNNAGAVVVGPLECLPMAEVRAQFEVNLFGPIALVQACLPLLRAGNGRILNVSSMNGRLAQPWSSVYAASKFALEAISDGLRVELGRWGIAVILVEPGAVATPLWSTAAERARENLRGLDQGALTLYRDRVEKLARAGRIPRRATRPEVVARVVGDALEAGRPRTRYLVGWDARLAGILAWFPDRLRDRLLDR